MSNCAKCGAELIGSRKFCAACGTPVGDARALGAPPSSAAAVNPFAATAPPNTMSPVAPRSSSDASPPVSKPGALSETETDPNALPVLPAPGQVSATVSPLAVSSVVSQGDGLDAAEAARQQVKDYQQQVESTPFRKPAGTQIMPSAPRPATPSPPEANPPAPKRQDRTHVMPAFSPASAPRPSGSTPSTSKMPVAPPLPPPPGSAPSSSRGSNPPGSQPNRGSAPPSAYGPPPNAPYSQAQQGHVPRSVAQPLPPSGAPSGYVPGQVPVTPAAPVVPGYPAPPATGAAPWSHGPHAAPPPQWGQPQAPFSPQPAPPSYGYPSFGYAPGARVLVTWSTGQRYPATVQQVTGSQCLVLFPDGQQHWVDMQYIAPG